MRVVIHFKKAQVSINDMSYIIENIGSVNTITQDDEVMFICHATGTNAYELKDIKSITIVED